MRPPRFQSAFCSSNSRNPKNAAFADLALLIEGTCSLSALVIIFSRLSRTGRWYWLVWSCEGPEELNKRKTKENKNRCLKRVSLSLSDRRISCGKGWRRFARIKKTQLSLFSSTSCLMFAPVCTPTWRWCGPPKLHVWAQRGKLDCTTREKLIGERPFQLLAINATERNFQQISHHPR